MPVQIYESLRGWSDEYFSLLVAHGAEVNEIYPPDHQAPLFYILDKKKDPEIVRQLLTAGADVAVKNKYGRTPLCHAVYSGIYNHEIIGYLLDAGSDISEADNEGMNTLDWARNNDMPFVITQLKKDGEAAEIDFTYKEFSIQVDNAIAENNVTAFKKYFSFGIDANSRDAFGNTLLGSVVILGTMEMLKMMVKKGADLNIKNKNQWTALLVVQYYHKNPETVEILKNAGAREFTKPDTFPGFELHLGGA